MSTWSHPQFIAKFWVLLKKCMLLACEPLEFQLCYPLGSEELKFCCFYYVEMFQRFRLSFQVCFSWQTILLPFFFFNFLFIFWSYSVLKSHIAFQKPFSRVAKYEVSFCFLGIFRFQGKENCLSYLDLWIYFMDFQEFKIIYPYWTWMLLRMQ